MKVFLIIVAVIVVIIIAAVVIKNAAKNYIHIESAAVCSRLYIDPDIEEPTVNLRKGGYIMVREGLDMIKISEETLKRSDVMFFETYDPYNPDQRKLVIAEKLDKLNYSAFILHNGTEVIYCEGHQAYMAKVAVSKVTISRGDGKVCGFETTTGDTSISFGDIWGTVKKVYGDYRIQSHC